MKDIENRGLDIRKCATFFFICKTKDVESNVLDILLLPSEAGFRVSGSLMGIT